MNYSINIIDRVPVDATKKLFLLKIGEDSGAPMTSLRK
jgi:hypothetical protein